MDKLAVREFKLNDLCDNPSIVVVGKRGSGKSWLIRDLLNKLNVPATVICPTEIDNPFYQKNPLVHKIYYKYDPQIISDLLHSQRMMRKLKKNQSYHLDEICVPDPEINDQTKDLLGETNSMIECSLITKRLDLSDIQKMKNNIDALQEQVIKQEVSRELKQTYDFIGSLLGQNIDTNDLEAIKNNIDDLINLKKNKVPLKKFNLKVKEKEVCEIRTIDSDDDYNCDRDRNRELDRVCERRDTDLLMDFIPSTMKFPKVTPCNHNDRNEKHALILDDCLASKTRITRDPVLTELMFNARSSQIPYVLAMQYPLGLSPEIRCNFDYVFLFADHYASNKKRLYEHYGGMFPDFSSFDQVFTELTKDFGCMVICNRGIATNITDKIYWYTSGTNEETAKRSFKVHL
ncbi:MAG: packaging ATPase [Dasosvirus sp.]|uniref:Packaging ATPase n=1 Tax=Dasosvirus sp. TaxID=2487764 RepID=A0A3G4ZT17_9VIRU|nr:MAG: packaging ATPase [Dasosvirus sp.]